MSSGARIDLRMLGSTELRREGCELDSVLSGAKRFGVFAYLTLARPRGFQRRDRVLPLFWPEHEQKSARNALSNILYHIRRELGEDLLPNRGAEEIGVCYNLLSCDVLAFEEALDGGAPKEALALYRGDLLGGFHVPGAAPAFDHSLEQERERLRRRAAKGAWTLAEVRERSGDAAGAHRWARRAVGFTPFSDSAQQRLIALLSRTGDRTGALQAYEAFATRLRTEWQMEPTAELRTLVATLENDSPPAGRSDPWGSASSSDHRVPDPLLVPRVSSLLDWNRPSWRHDSSPPRNKHPHAVDRRGKWPPRWRTIGIIVLMLLGIGAVWGFGWETSPPIRSAPAGDRPSVAVLPFTALGTEDATDYFSLGMTEEILARLATVSDLSVISRTSVMQYRDTETPVQQIAAELGASAVVEGSVQRAGDRVRITAQLIDAQTDRHLWGASYDRRLKDVLAVQSDVALRIAEALRASLLPQERAQLNAQRDVNETAYHLYLRAKYLLDEGEPTGVARAAMLFQEALAHDSTFASAYGGLAMTAVQLGSFNGKDPHVYTVEPLSPAHAESQALRSAKRALAHDSTVVDAHLAQALVYEIFQQEWERSEHAFRQALQLNPSRSTTHREYGWLMLRLGHVDRALPHMRRAVALDPLSWAAHHGLGYALHCSRQYEDAIQTLETALELGSGDPIARKHLLVALLKRGQQLDRQGRAKDALNHVKRAGTVLTALWGTNIDSSQQHLLELASTGQRDAAIAQLNHVSLPFGPRLYVNLLMAQRDTALTMIAEVDLFNQRRVFVDPIFDAVRDDARFKRLVERRLKYDENPSRSIDPHVG